MGLGGDEDNKDLKDTIKGDKKEEVEGRLKMNQVTSLPDDIDEIITQLN